MPDGALPKTEENSTPAAEPTIIPEPQTTPPEIKKGESKILEPKYDSAHTCNYDKCPITKKQILFGMHCVFYKNKTYHALCAKQSKINFTIQQPARRAKEPEIK